MTKRTDIIVSLSVDEYRKVTDLCLENSFSLTELLRKGLQLISLALRAKKEGGYIALIKNQDVTKIEL